eukprot:scaffold40782_cov191-Amphora_coffeaeformis.AAC.4
MFKSWGNNRSLGPLLLSVVAELGTDDDSQRVGVTDRLLRTTRGIRALAPPCSDPIVNKDIRREEAKMFIGY